MMNNYDCYGKQFARLTKCIGCEYFEWCRDARDLPLSGHVSFEAVSALIGDIESEANEYDDASRRMNNSILFDGLRQLSLDLLELPDDRTKSIILLKLANPDMTLHQIGHVFGITRQSVGLRLRNLYEKNPRLKVFLRNLFDDRSPNRQGRMTYAE